MRVTNKMADNYNVYNLNKNKNLLDKLNNQMSSKKKYNEPMDAPVIAARSLHFRADLSEIEQFLGKNVTDAISWTDTTQTAIDTGKDILRSLKSEYTSAANGTNKNEDRWVYYNNMMNLVNEFYAVGNTTNENRYVFTGARTVDSFTFNEKNFDDRVKDIKAANSAADIKDSHVNTFKYVDITETFDINDLQGYTFTARQTGAGGKPEAETAGITLEEIAKVTEKNDSGYVQDVDETHIQNVEAYRLRLSYENIDAKPDTPESYTVYERDKNGEIVRDASGEPKTVTKTAEADTLILTRADKTTKTYNVIYIDDDFDINGDNLSGDNIYLNYKTGNLIFGDAVHETFANELKNGGSISFSYNKSTWKEDDVKPEHYFKCVDIGLGTTAKESIDYFDFEQSINYNVGDNQIIKVNTNANRVFSLDAIRDLNEIRDALKAVEAAEEKVNKLQEMQEDSLRYSEEDLAQIGYLLAAAEKEFKYATEKVDKLYSNGMTRSQDYFDTANLAGTDMGTTVKRLTIIRNRLTENQTTITAQASDNENIDITTTAVDVNAATLSYGAALQVTGKISQQSLVNFL